MSYGFGASGWGHNPAKPKEAPTPPSDEVMAALALSRVEDAAKAHSIAVQAAVNHTRVPTPTYLVDDVLAKGTALDHALTNASKWHSPERLAQVAYLHPMYVADLLAGMF